MTQLTAIIHKLPHCQLIEPKVLLANGIKHTELVATRTLNNLWVKGDTISISEVHNEFDKLAVIMGNNEDKEQTFYLDELSEYFELTDKEHDFF